MAILVLLFVVVPLLELALVIRVGQILGVAEAILLLLVISVLGAWLAKHQGLGVWRRFREQLDAGNVPGAEIVDGVLILLAGALLLTPGFLTDAVALLTLLPPVRALVRRRLRRFAARRVTAGFQGTRYEWRRHDPVAPSQLDDEGRETDGREP